LIGREDLKNDKIGGGEDGVEIVSREKFFFNYINRCAVSLHSANLVVNKATAEIAIRTDFRFIELIRDSFSIFIFKKS
jgi:hypothetical protein